ncbi:MAG: hypothetical protein CMJ50_06820 [Planctomycetaceae bacterium]|nr:hypothetical protein [Planctomycetaceae bacterium]
MYSFERITDWRGRLEIALSDSDWSRSAFDQPRLARAAFIHPSLGTSGYSGCGQNDEPDLAVMRSRELQ